MARRRTPPAAWWIIRKLLTREEPIDRLDIKAGCLGPDRPIRPELGPMYVFLKLDAQLISLVTSFLDIFEV